ncbi:unnamed protein product [Clonostachys solani]|uniref:Aspartate aminotransferase n=1 Tax=Clonostachys solani TaxID=160281 RepID=A0A9P0EE17_9HYPO|nr:unnamed protein product [Clonostachys solani]
MFFDSVQQGPPDIMYHLKVQADGDTSPNKVDLGVGIYRNEKGAYHELKALRDYEVTTGNSKYLQLAAALVFGKNSQLVASSQVASVQTISGTGSIHVALMFLSHSVPGKKRTVYVGTPAWGNYEPMTKLAGLDFQSYKHYSPETGGVDWESVTEAASSAPQGSIFVLQACCHNPTAADFSEEQWRDLATIMKRRQLIPLFDIAYQGLGNGLEKDIYCVRHFAQEGLEMLVCQSFSKNFGLYGERVGALHAVALTQKAAMAIHDQLRFLIRSEFSSSPAFGARLVTHVLSDSSLEASWNEELNDLRQRLHTLRAKLFDLLSNVYKNLYTEKITDSRRLECNYQRNWAFLVGRPWRALVTSRDANRCSLLPLSPQQCQELKNEYHIYMVPNGRITIPGLNAKNIEYVAKSINSVVRDTQTHAGNQPVGGRQ